MSISSRPLIEKSAIEEFFHISLGHNYQKDSRLGGESIIAKIADGEMGVEKIANDRLQTLSSMRMRDRVYREEANRWLLREKIIEELLTEKRLLNDDDIELGKGGALPLTELKHEAKVFIIIGLPASGKSSIASDIADEFGAIILDSDYAKRKLPEYRVHKHGASLVHDESKQIIVNFTIPNPREIRSAFERCIEQDVNLVIPTIGNDPERIIDQAKQLKKDAGYKVHLILVSASKREATIRAARRFAETDRYVPLGLIFDVFSNDPSCCYYYLRSKTKNLFASFGVVSTMAGTPECTDSKGNTPVKRYPKDNSTLSLP